LLHRAYTLRCHLLHLIENAVVILGGERAGARQQRRR